MSGLPNVSRKLFESTVVFRALVGQSSLKTKIHTPTIFALSPPVYTPLLDSTSSQNFNSTLIPNLNSNSSQESSSHCNPSSITTSFTTSPSSILIALGQLSLTNASPTFPLHYLFQRASTSLPTTHRLLCLPPIEITDENVLRKYVMTSVTEGAFSLSNDPSQSLSTLVIVGSQAVADRGTIESSQTVTVYYAIVVNNNNAISSQTLNTSTNP